MSETRKNSVLRGFDTAVADIGDQLSLCHPLLSFDGDESPLYVARKLNWEAHQDALAVVDRSEAAELATLLVDEHRQPIASGLGVAVAGVDFVRAAAVADIELGSVDTPFTEIHELRCSIGTATLARFEELRTRLVNEARRTFDRALGSSVRRGRHLDERGRAALLILRRCGPHRREDLAVRQLAAARQDEDFDLYRRLLVRFELELNSPQNQLDRRAQQHIEICAQDRSHHLVDLMEDHAHSAGDPFTRWIRAKFEFSDLRKRGFGSELAHEKPLQSPKRAPLVLFLSSAPQHLYRKDLAAMEDGDWAGQQEAV